MDYISESGYSSDEDNYFKEEIAKFKRSFKVLGLLKRSAHAEIYLGRYRKTEQHVIMKIIPKKGKTKWCNEAKSHQLATTVDKQGTTHLLGVYERLRDIILVIEKPPNSLDILDAVNHYGSFNLPMVKQVVAQIGRSVMAYKKAGLVHGDIKDENVMLDPFTLATKIIDFGNARSYGNGTVTSNFGTPAFFPPELVDKTESSNDAATVYSIGCMAYIMLTGTCPFEEDSPFDFEKFILLNNDLQLAEIKFLQRLLHPNPSCRVALNSL